MVQMPMVPGKGAMVSALLDPAGSSGFQGLLVSASLDLVSAIPLAFITCTWDLKSTAPFLIFEIEVLLESLCPDCARNEG